MSGDPDIFGISSGIGMDTYIENHFNDGDVDSMMVVMTSTCGFIYSCPNRLVKLYRMNGGGQWRSVGEGCDDPCEGWRFLVDFKYQIKTDPLNIEYVCKSADVFMNEVFKPKYSKTVRGMRRHMERTQRAAPLTRVFGWARIHLVQLLEQQSGVQSNESENARDEQSNNS